jgi:hypothetical protein
MGASVGNVRSANQLRALEKNLQQKLRCKRFYLFVAIFFTTFVSSMPFKKLLRQSLMR